MNRALAPFVLLLSLAFALSPAVNGGFPGFSPTQFPIVQSRWPVQPVGWAFSIWGPVFLGLIASAGWGLWRRRNDPQWQAMRVPLAVSLAIGTLWITVANVEPLIATVMIIFMAAAATEALLRAPREFAAWGPVGLYAGWVSAAAGVAIGAVLSGYGVLSPQIAALAILVVLSLVGVAVIWVCPAPPGYLFGLCWAYMGVIVAGLDPLNAAVVALSGVAILKLTALSLVRRPA